MLKNIDVLLLMIAGILLILSGLNIINFGSVSTIIFLILFIVEIIVIIKRKSFIYIPSFIAGVLYFTACFGLIAFEVIWPFIVILVSITMCLSIFFRISKMITDSKNEISYSTVFSNVKREVSSSEYIGGGVTALFGHAYIDYSKIKIKGEEGYVNATVIFGGATIIVPKNVKVTLNIFPIFGGTENKAESDENAKKELIINCVVVFGGVEIKN